METRTGSRVFAMVAGEDSGDLLGAELIEALRTRHPEAKFVGVGGPRMRAAGLDAWHDIAELSVMGFAEVLRHLPRLLRLRASLARRLIALQPDAFIGIDAPDFNFGLERKLKDAGVPVVHYVSPSIWAWRENRAEKIGKSTDTVLCLFPMEPPLYAKHGVDARFVGHPLADRFPLVPDRDAARRELGLAADAPVLAVLPGSRLSEIHRLGAIFMEAAQRIAAEIPGLQIVVPTANARCRDQLESLLRKSGLGTRDSGFEKAGSAPVTATPNAAAPDIALKAPDSTPFPSPESRVPTPVLLDGHAHRAMVAADVVLLASGTAALEAMLAKRPMVVGYRIAALTHALVKGFGMLKTNLYALPNVLAGRMLVPELMQRDCTPEKLADAVTALFRDKHQRDELIRAFERMHLALHKGGGAAASAARAIDDMLAARNEAAP
ncbi:MAG: lipid-A-disaccharide synthase [Rhodanobacteraceae bacterium]|jgi:lipid-A-disaccharide synthase|nr:MAG: lipid-A-disaccharide synthase [Rhodanobacteraceae bacterium]